MPTAKTTNTTNHRAAQFAPPPHPPWVADWWRQFDALPLAPYFKANVRYHLNTVLCQANANRSRRLMEFFKSVDWLPLADIKPNPLDQLPAETARHIRHDLETYLAEKAQKKARQKNQQQDYKLRVIHYFKDRLSREDKQLLERLRDYELDLTGQDANWQHYFRLTSFKQIDAFGAMSTSDRMQRIAAFKFDVQTRCYHEKKLQTGQYWGFYNDGLGFDPANLDETLNNWHQNHKRQHQTDPADQPNDSAMKPTGDDRQAALEILSLPANPDPKTVRARFRELALALHPDRPGGSSEKMKAVLWAYKTLSPSR
ncbi:MAG: J domain-containing protein [Cyanobacteria bacterium HKST-UBA06]|nr:J domain-containing protein [Cyanobacteria bacterium HKST-UBA06]